MYSYLKGKIWSANGWNKSDLLFSSFLANLKLLALTCNVKIREVQLTT